MRCFECRKKKKVLLPVYEIGGLALAKTAVCRACFVLNYEPWKVTAGKRRK